MFCREIVLDFANYAASTLQLILRANQAQRQKLAPEGEDPQLLLCGKGENRLPVSLPRHIENFSDVNLPPRIKEWEAQYRRAGVRPEKAVQSLLVEWFHHNEITLDDAREGYRQWQRVVEQRREFLNGAEFGKLGRTNVDNTVEVLRYPLGREI